MMRTGDGEMDTSGIESAAMDLFLPVMESATVLAAHYAKACGRTCITAQDMSYGLMFAARNVMGKHTGSLYPEVYESESQSDSSESGSESDPEGSDSFWSRYEGTDDDTARKMNECADTWDHWVPTSPAERALKNAVDKNSFFGRG
jgi:histone H3/H4